ncbi:MAG: hypothetical protein ISQ90_05560 [Rhodospirillales bacterium]|nr:hypothetical protein [Rhodospirillales bacterium]
MSVKESNSMSKKNLADHFLACAKLDRYLTIETDVRFFITDDFINNSILHEAAAMAAIYSKDNLVAEAALMPLGGKLSTISGNGREKYERLFELIRNETLSDPVRARAENIIDSRFDSNEIRDLGAQLGSRISPARDRYKNFLSIVKKLMENNITSKPFIEEFRNFTDNVAGKLDFGIYSFCLDNMFKNIKISEDIKKLLLMELLSFPNLIRRELLSNLLSQPNQEAEFIEFTNMTLNQQLSPESVVEIIILKDIKMRRLSMDAINSLARENTTL